VCAKASSRRFSSGSQVHSPKNWPLDSGGLQCAASMEQTKGFFRHHLGSVTIDPEGEGARVKGYNLVTDWSDGGKLILLARYSILAVRTGAGWRLSRVDVKVDH